MPPTRFAITPNTCSWASLAHERCCNQGKYYDMHVHASVDAIKCRRTAISIFSPNFFVIQLRLQIFLKKGVGSNFFEQCWSKNITRVLYRRRAFCQTVNDHLV